LFTPQIKSILERKKQTDRIAKEKAREKSDKDEQDRVFRAVAGVNHLEIPADLAFLLTKLEGNFYLCSLGHVFILIH